MTRRYGCSVPWATHSKLASSGPEGRSCPCRCGRSNIRCTPGLRRSASRRIVPATGLGDRHGQVGGRGGLALLWHGAGDQDRPDRVIDIGDVHVGAKGSVRFRGLAPRIEQGCQAVSRAVPGPSRLSVIVPIVGRPIRASTSSEVFSVSSRYSRRNARAIAVASASRATIRVLRATRGLIGSVGTWAGSTMVRMLASPPLA